MKKWIRFWGDDSGATAIEYGLIAAALAGMLIAVMPTLTGAIKDKLSAIASDVKSTPAKTK